MIYVLFLAAYFMLLLGIGFAFSKRMRSLEDFFLASRGLSAFWVFISLVASWIGATSILVSVDEAYTKGLSSFWIMGVPAVLTVFVFMLFLARPIRELPILTLPDLVENRYGRTVRHLAALLIVWYMILLAASQMVALGNFLQGFLHTSYFTCLVIGTGVVLVYSVFGGFRAVVLTDGLQFFFLAAGIFGLFLFLEHTTKIQDVFQVSRLLEKPDYFSFLSDVKRNTFVALSFVLAWLVSPIAWQRIQAARTVHKARLGLLSAAVTLFLIYGLIVAIGLLALPHLPPDKVSGSVLSSIIVSKAGVFLGGILFISVMAAVMSTMDTAINTGALSFTHDVYFQLLPKRGMEQVVAVSRISTVFIAAVAFLVATMFQDILKTLGLASEIMAEGFFVPGICMIFLKKKWPAAGFLSLVLGGGFALVGFMSEIEIVAIGWPMWPYSVPYGLALSLTGFLIGMLIDRYGRGLAKHR
jgi:SSS family solute:Na+ symporter